MPLPRWSSLRLRSKGLVVVALPILPVAVLWSLIGLALLRGSPPANTLGRTQDIQIGLTQIVGALLEAEAAARTNDDGPDAALRQGAAAGRVGEYVQDVDRAIIDAVVRNDFERLRTAAGVALEHLLAARQGLAGEPEALVAASTAIAEVRSLADAIQTRQRALTSERTADNRRREGIFLVLFFTASLACTGGGIMAALILAKGIERRIATLTVNAERLATGEPVEAVPDGDDEIAHLGLRLRDASRLLRQRETELREVNGELEAFSYSVSHDLRAPLRAIDGFSQVIEEDQAERLDEGGRNALKRVRAAAGRMGLLIDELLSLARITRAELRRETVDVSEMAAGIVAEMARAAPDRQVRVAIADGLRAEADARLLRIALQNLLHNAWKYTGKTADAQIEVGAIEDPARGFYVRDNGAGFDMQHAGRLFGAFQRMHTDREFEGTGIGLATVQRIVHKHGGRIWADSAVDEGSTFFFTLDKGTS
jgi:signal transduction histidine kinase